VTCVEPCCDLVLSTQEWLFFTRVAAITADASSTIYRSVRGAQERCKRLKSRSTRVVVR